MREKKKYSMGTKHCIVIYMYMYVAICFCGFYETVKGLSTIFINRIFQRKNLVIKMVIMASGGLSKWYPRCMDNFSYNFKERNCTYIRGVFIVRFWFLKLYETKIPAFDFIHRRHFFVKYCIWGTLIIWKTPFTVFKIERSFAEWYIYNKGAYC